ncbi:dephospho-CoA kinase [Oscillospiraceae bacterium MB08-C2-2]|nr:dephospho-CoA kinase [Oscillospiraceae bacterium MB08-C2-2]
MIIGLTGQTGAGKTFVSDLLAARGLIVINADEVARHVVDQGAQCLTDLVLEFTIEILNEDGSLNRRRMGDLVFSDKAKRMRFNEIIFPYIHEEIKERIAFYQKQGAKLIVLDAPTLFESGADRYCDRIVSVIAPKELRMERIIARDDLSRQQAEQRMKAQHDDEFYTSKSHVVICNDGDMGALRVQVMELLDRLNTELTKEMS